MNNYSSLGDKDLRPEYPRAVLPLCDGVVVAGGEPHAEEVDAVAGEDEDQDDQQDGHLDREERKRVLFAFSKFLKVTNEVSSPI